VYWFSVRIAIPSELRNGDPSLVVAMVVVVVAKQRLCDAMRCDAMRGGFDSAATRCHENGAQTMGNLGPRGCSGGLL
jgi:hypothetical protein